MVKQKSPAFQFYPAEFLADENVELMSLAEQGVYIRLLSYCWREGSIPGDIELLARLCRCAQGDMETYWNRVQKCFKNDPKNADRLIHSRLQIEKEKQKKNAEKKRQAAEKRWGTENRRDASALQVDMHMQCPSSSISSSSSISPEGVNTPLPPTTKPVVEKKQAKQEKISMVADDWLPSDAWWKWLDEKYPQVPMPEAMDQIDRWKDWCKAKGQKFLDFNAALRKWFDSPYYSGESRKPKPPPRKPDIAHVTPAAERKEFIHVPPKYRQPTGQQPLDWANPSA